MLDRDVILPPVAHFGRGECQLGHTARLWWGKRVPGRVQCGGLITLAIQVRGVRFLGVFDADQRCREAGDLRLLGHNQRDRLASKPIRSS
jgi:hypothetical protein